MLTTALLLNQAGGDSPEPEPGTSEPDVITEVAEKEEVDDGSKTPWRVILYNDEVHTFDEVIGQIMKATGCPQSKAEELTLKVHNEGKATVYEGTFDECFEVNGVLKEIQLITEIKG